MVTQGNAARPIYVLPADGGEEASSRLSLASALAYLWESRVWIVVFAVLGLGAGIALDLVKTKIYHSETLLVAAQPERGSALSGVGSQIGGLASLAGINIPNAGSARTEALAVLTSREFVGNFITQHKLMPILYFKLWNPANRTWNVSDPKKIPTTQDAFEYFSKSVMMVDDDKKTGLVTVSIEWRDRYLAAEWANEIVADLNENLRRRAIVESTDGVAYLDGVLKKGALPDTEQQAIYSLIESQMASEMVANVRKQFAFKVLDPAVVSDADRFVRPNLLMLIASGVFFAIIFGIALRVFAAARIERLWQTVWGGRPHTAMSR